MYSRLLPWLREKSIAFQENAAIGPLLYFKIGGRVSLLVRCTSALQLAACLQKISREKIPYLVIGGGSNIAFNDGLTRAVVLVFQEAVKKTNAARLLDEQTLQVDGGIKNQVFLSWCAAHGAGGLEFLSGIPGTMGGAAAVNAGAFGQALADFLLGADIVDNSGNKLAVDAGHFGFSYRDSSFKFGNEVILSLRLRFSKADQTAIAREMEKNLDYRLSRHPSYRIPSAGCFFKNPLQAGGKISAGKIIEACGLKNLSVGALTVAAEHGNFLLNRGNASFADLQRLESEIKAAVAARQGIALEREVVYVSPDGKKY
jgi:UDP-N-acetylmuramate dehydrogenase